MGTYYSLTTYPAWVDENVNENSIPAVLSSLCAKNLFISVGDKYVGSPIIEYLYYKMQNAKIWLSIADMFFVYFDEDITISIYKKTDNNITVTPYEKPVDCFTSIKAVICDRAEGIFMVDKPSHNVRTYVEMLKSMWEDCNEQR